MSCLLDHTDADGQGQVFKNTRELTNSFSAVFGRFSHDVSEKIIMSPAAFENLTLNV